MKLETIVQQCLLLGVAILSVSLVISEPVSMDAVETADVPPEGAMGRFAYVVTDLRQRRNGLSLLAPPNMYQQKFAPFLHKMPSKRDGLWIWMPAQGYVSVPRQGAAGGPRKGGSNNLLRYG